MVTNACTPAAAEAFMRMAFDIDVRHVAPAINVPTLIVHAADDQVCNVENGRFLARTIPGARYVELPDGITSRGSTPTTVAEIREFLDRDGARRRRPTARSRRCCSPTSSARRSAQRSSATAAGATCSNSITPPCGASWRRFDGHEQDTAGDGFFATFDGPARAIRCAAAIIDALRPLDLDVRAGLHTGEVELHDGKVAGIAVNIGARVAAQGEPGEVLVSSTVKDLVAGSGLDFEDRGTTSLKGIPGEWRLFAVRPN